MVSARSLSRVDQEGFAVTPFEAGQVFVTPEAYADPARFHEACAVLRRDDPIHLVESADYVPFHAITSTPTSSRSRCTTVSGRTRRAR